MAHTPPGRTRERVWRFVRGRLLAGDPPTVREVQREFGFRAVESARAHLEALVEAGLLVKDGGGGGARPARGGPHGTGRGGARGPARGAPRRRARGYRLPDLGVPAPALVPVLGRVQAGALTTALEEAEGAVAVQARLPAEDLFALRVRGDSMRDAGILEGDLVIVRRTAADPREEDGRIVVALVGEEATVKRLRVVRRGGAARGATAHGVRIELHPENPDFDVIAPPPEDVRILGRVIEVRRHLDPATPPPWEGDVLLARGFGGGAARGAAVPPDVRDADDEAGGATRTGRSARRPSRRSSRPGGPSSAPPETA